MRRNTAEDEDEWLDLGVSSEGNSKRGSATNRQPPNDAAAVAADVAASTSIASSPAPLPSTATNTPTDKVTDDTTLFASGKSSSSSSSFVDTNVVFGAQQQRKGGRFEEEEDFAESNELNATEATEGAADEDVVVTAPTATAASFSLQQHTQTEADVSDDDDEQHRQLNLPCSETSTQPPSITTMPTVATAIAPTVDDTATAAVATPAATPIVSSPKTAAAASAAVEEAPVDGKTEEEEVTTAPKEESPSPTTTPTTAASVKQTTGNTEGTSAKTQSSVSASQFPSTTVASAVPSTMFKSGSSNDPNGTTTTTTRDFLYKLAADLFLAPLDLIPSPLIAGVLRGILKGFTDSANMFQFIKYCAKDTSITQTFIQCSALNAILFFSLFTIVNLISPLQPTGAFAVVWETLFSLLWIVPMYTVTQILGITWYEEIYRKCVRVRAKDRHRPEPPTRAVSFIGFSELIMKFLVTLVYGILAAIVAVAVPTNFIVICGVINIPVGFMVSFCMSCWLHAFYCFDYRFLDQGRIETSPSNANAGEKGANGRSNNKNSRNTTAAVTSTAAVIGGGGGGATATAELSSASRSAGAATDTNDVASSSVTASYSSTAPYSDATTAASASSASTPKLIPAKLSYLIQIFEKKWPYYLGYGASHIIIRTIMEWVELPLFARMAVCSALFAVNVVTTVEASVKWEGDQYVSRMPIFTPFYKKLSKWAAMFNEDVGKQQNQHHRHHQKTSVNPPGARGGTASSTKHGGGGSAGARGSASNTSLSQREAATSVKKAQ